MQRIPCDEDWVVLRSREQAELGVELLRIRELKTSPVLWEMYTVGRLLDSKGRLCLNIDAECLAYICHILRRTFVNDVPESICDRLVFYANHYNICNQQWAAVSKQDKKDGKISYDVGGMIICYNEPENGIFKKLESFFA